MKLTVFCVKRSFCVTRRYSMDEICSMMKKIDCENENSKCLHDRVDTKVNRLSSILTLWTLSFLNNNARYVVLWLADYIIRINCCVFLCSDWLMMVVYIILYSMSIYIYIKYIEPAIYVSFTSIVLRLLWSWGEMFNQ